ncbi:MAG: hypothetical protein EOO52_19395 [Gammaproteobacteria bacterium]|nr:MAG: hypothetical protein EOO52_19395 [Gammaproteobacteria bacterium]
MKEIPIEAGTVKSFFAKIDGLSRIFDSEKDLGIFLWRASRTDEPCENPLYPDFVPRQLREGKFRPADVTVEKRNGIDYIIPKVYQKRPEDIWKAQGTSLFNKPNTFIGKNWEYIEIPQGTEIPAGVLIIKDDFNTRFEATHYSIVPDHAMSVENFKLLLKKLLINIEAQRGKLKNG